MYCRECWRREIQVRQAFFSSLLLFRNFLLYKTCFGESHSATYVLVTTQTEEENVNKFYLILDFCQSASAGVHANPDDCYGFIMCDMAGNTHEMACPGELKFNSALLVCDWPDNVECEEGSGISG